MFATATLTQSYRSRNEDRLDVIAHPDGLVAVIADGAGGTSGGAEAADAVLLWVRSYVTRAADLREPNQWADLLFKIDNQISFANGQTTAVVAAVSGDGVYGASVGDSAAWLIPANTYDNLTANQVRKPLLGTGAAKPVPFERSSFAGTVLLASDGLINYAPPSRICELARAPDLTRAAAALIDLVRLRSGALQDDTALILCRPRSSAAPVQSSRKRYRLTPDGDMVEEDT